MFLRFRRFFMKIGLYLCTCITIIGFVPVYAGSVYEIERGNPERKAVLDALRPTVEAQMRGPVEFVVRKITADGDWAFVVVDPQRPGGIKIDPSKTAFFGSFHLMDGFTVYGLLKFQNDRWNMIDHMIGPTDAAFIGWRSHYGVSGDIFSSRGAASVGHGGK